MTERQLCGRCKLNYKTPYGKYYCLECYRVKNAEYRKRYPEKVRIWQKTARTKRDTDPVKKQAKTDKDGWYIGQIRLRVFEKLGGARCNFCGFNDIRALQIDHVEGGGVQELKKIKSKNSYYRKILEFPSGYQVLCANCNWIKRHTHNESKKWKNSPKSN